MFLRILLTSIEVVFLCRPTIPGQMERMVNRWPRNKVAGKNPAE